MENKQEEIYQSKEYKNSIIKSHKAFLEFLISNQISFTIIAHTHAIYFKPEIPSSVIKFDKLLRLDIANYTLETSKVENDELIIQTAFGIENFETILSIPLEAIFQIAIKQDLIALNYYIPKEREKNSLNIFLNNPANAKILNKRKK